MKAFKTDENLPIDAATPLRQAGLDVATVLDERLGGHADADILRVCRSEGRALITLDVDFANIDAYRRRRSLATGYKRTSSGFSGQVGGTAHHLSAADPPRFLLRELLHIHRLIPILLKSSGALVSVGAHRLSLAGSRHRSFVRPKGDAGAN